MTTSQLATSIPIMRLGLTCTHCGGPAIANVKIEDWGQGSGIFANLCPACMIIPAEFILRSIEVYEVHTE